jgi:hypothetical protein
MPDYTKSQVWYAIQQFGRYRTRRCQEIAREDAEDRISGAHFIAMGLRETGLRNIRGGIIWDSNTNRWVKQPDYRKQDVGWLQISQIYHEDALKAMVGVTEGTWAPTINGKTAADKGCVPRFTDSLRYTVDELHEAQAYGEDHGVEERHLARFAVAAHNAGIGGALSGYARGNVDLYTTGKDYSAWVLRHIKIVREVLREHTSYKV